MVGECMMADVVRVDEKEGLDPAVELKILYKAE